VRSIACSIASTNSPQSSVRTEDSSRSTLVFWGLRASERQGVARELGIVAVRDRYWAERLPEMPRGSTRWTRPRGHDDALELGQQDDRKGDVSRRTSYPFSYPPEVI
jgi:hypothetical protein